MPNGEVDFLAKATKPLRDLHFDQPVIATRIPVTPGGWKLAQARLVEVDGLQAAAAAVHALAEETGYKDRITVARTAASALRELMDVAETIAAIDHGRPDIDHGLREAIDALAAGWAGTLGKSGAATYTASKSSDLVDRVAFALDRLATTETGTDDPCMAVFGVSRANLGDAGAVARTRLMESFYGRWPDLIGRLERLLAPIGPCPSNVATGAGLALTLLESDDPYLSIRSARATRRVVRDAFQQDATATTNALAGLISGADRMDASQRMVDSVLRSLGASSSREERVLFTLDIYRRKVEGQLRPLVWAVHQLATGVEGSPPLLGNLRPKLASRDDFLSACAADFISLAVRNAAAHEDYYWDARRQRLVAGDSELTEEQVHCTSSSASAFINGLTVGLQLAIHEEPSLEADLNLHDPASMTAAAARERALDFFGANGLRMTDWLVEGDCLTVQIEDLPPHRYSPSIQAAMWACQHLADIDRFVVTVSGHQQPALELSRSTLEAMVRLWHPARHWWSKMPPSVFVPALLEARLAVESAADAATAASWLALNEAVHAIRDVEESDTPLVIRWRDYTRRLYIICEGLDVCCKVVPDQRDALQGRGYRAMRGALRYSDELVASGDMGRLREMVELIDRLFDELEAVAILPTVDLRRPRIRGDDEMH